MYVPSIADARACVGNIVAAAATIHCRTTVDSETRGETAFPWSNRHNPIVKIVDRG